ncbi:MAG: hypothetical protein ACI8TX_002074 [Hyphomicrobiaceae bacterium]
MSQTQRRPNLATTYGEIMKNFAAHAICGIAAVGLAVPTFAVMPEPGTVVSAANLAEYRDVLGPGLEWIVERGVDLPVVAHKETAFPPRFAAATEKYSSQVQIADDCTHITNHVAGLPFPSVDDTHKCAAAMHMFNFNASIAVDDLDLRNFDCDTGSVGKNGEPVRVERHFLIDHIRRLYWVERTTVEPFPVMENPDEVRYKEALYPLIEPFDLKGTGFTSNRYLDHTRQDDSWLYLPQLRRVRRLSSAQRSDALFGQDTDQDSYAGYAGNIAWMEWSLLGEKDILGAFHSENLPVKWGEPSADFMQADVWEPRKVWVVEGVSKLPQYAYSKRVIYLDQEAYIIPFTDIYDSAGELWKVWVNNFKYATHPFPGAQFGFDYDVSYNASITMVDMQLEHATFCALPSSRFPGEQGWYINLGDEEGTTSDFFELSAIISAGR